MEVVALIFSVLALIASSLAIVGNVVVGRGVLRANKRADEALKLSMESAELCKEICEAHLASEQPQGKDLDVTNLPPDMPQELQDMLKAMTKSGAKVQFMKFPKNEAGECQCPDCTAEREANKEAKPSQENLH